MSETPEDFQEDEVVDGLPVPAAPAVVEPSLPAPVPARQAAALAATGFVAGRGDRGGRAPPPRPGAAAQAQEAKNGLGEIVASNSFLVDVHLLRRD